MKWRKQGRIFIPDGSISWMKSYAWVPTLDKIRDNYYKIYFASRSKDNLSQIGYVVIDIKQPSKIISISQKPILKLGELGMFDDSAVIPSWIINYKNKKLFYYIGWMQGKRVPFYASTGLAISNDNGETFQKYSPAPIIPKDRIDPYMTASVSVIFDNNRFKMWYLSGVAWKLINRVAQSYYHIKYAESEDGINWNRKGIVCIDFKNSFETRISRPCVIKINNLYHMWYSYAVKSYKIGYAQSKNGIDWIRMDKKAGIFYSTTGWDSKMLAYPYVIENNDSLYLFYNGNNYGETGFGYAICENNL